MKFVLIVARALFYNMIKSICLVRLSALGDVLMVVPLVRALQRAMPDAKLTWVICRPAYDLVEGMDGVEFIVIDKPRNLADYWRFKKQLHTRSFDVLLATQASLRANLLYACIRAKRKIGYDRVRAKDGHGWFIDETIPPGDDHTLDGFLKFAHALGVIKPEVRWDLPIPDDAKRWVGEQLSSVTSPFCIVNPAASKPERSWSAERYIEVIRFIQKEYNMPVILTGGPGDNDKILGDAIATEVPVINLIGKTKPKLLLELIRRATLMLCPDTGPSHMACAVDTSVIALHAVTNVNISGPYTYRHQAVNVYPEAVRQVLGKTLETCPWGTHVHGFEAMTLISVEMVVVQIKRVMNDR